jgi:hypothetical protein
MAGKIERTRNFYDNINAQSAITLNTATFVKLLDARQRRINYKVSNTSLQQILIIEENPNGDNTSRGFLIYGNERYESQSDNIPVGEIWAKALVGSPNVYVVESYDEEDV